MRSARRSCLRGSSTRRSPTGSLLAQDDRKVDGREKRRGETASGVRQSTRITGRRHRPVRGAVFHNVGTMDAAAGIWPGPNIVTGGSLGERAGEKARRSYCGLADRACRCRAPCGWCRSSVPVRTTGCPAPALESRRLRIWAGGGSSDQQPATVGWDGADRPAEVPSPNSGRQSCAPSSSRFASR
jgi:hypothetical protein